MGSRFGGAGVEDVVAGVEVACRRVEVGHCCLCLRAQGSRVETRWDRVSGMNRTYSG